jgi:hypothetical protein
VVDGNTIYLIAARSISTYVKFQEVYALNKQSGDTLWSYRPSNPAGSSGAPIVVNNTLVFDNGRGYIALNKITGQLRWSQSYAYSSNPWYWDVVGNPAANLVYVWTGELKAIDVNTGQVTWSYDNIGGYSSTVPILVDGLVYQVSQWENDNKTYLYSFDAVTGALKNKVAIFPISGNYVFMTAANGILYITTNQYYYPLVRAIDLATGATVWESSEHNASFSPIVIANGKIFVDSYDQGLFVYGSVQPLSYSISGRVVQQVGSLTRPLPGITVTARSGSGEPLNSVTNELDGRYTFTDVPPGQYTVEPQGTYYFSPETQQTQIIAANVTLPDFVVTFPPSPPLPEPYRFKGANWLLLENYTDEDGVGWNLDLSGDILGDRDFPSELDIAANVHNLYARSGVGTIVRLGRWGDNDPVKPGFTYTEALSYPCTHPTIVNWMDEVDVYYHNVITLYDRYNDYSNPGAIPIFVLGNEPNHPVEWGYTGEAYAHLYNCYYYRWRVEENRPHGLYVAGPGHFGLEGYYGNFYRGLLPNLAGADGFAIHTYGYFDTSLRDGAPPDPTGAEFRKWLNEAIDAIGARRDLKNRPVIITEYNPGADMLPGENQARCNQPNNWENWFNQTYCWARDGFEDAGLNIQGLLFYVDGMNPERNTRDTQWQCTALERDLDKRLLWRNTPSASCAQINGRQVEAQAQTNTLSGVISGTVGIPFDYDVYYATGNLNVPAGETLTIESGTTLVFEPGAVMTVTGRLIANGNPVYPVRLINDSDGWGGLRFLPSAAGSVCNGCLVQNIAPGGVGLQIDAPITIKHSVIRDVYSGTAIAASVPFTLTNTIIDYAGVGLSVTGAVTTTTPFTVSHLTLSRYKTGVENNGARLTVENSILSSSNIGLNIKQGGTTILRFSLLHRQMNPINVITGGVYLEGPGVLTSTQPYFDLFAYYPDNLRLVNDAVAVNAADPAANYDNEPGYNGGRADMGAYGNTIWSPQQPSVEQMGVSLQGDGQTPSARMGETLTWTVRLKNEGQLTDTFTVQVGPTHERHSSDDVLFGRLTPDERRFAGSYTLAPQEVVTFTVTGTFEGNPHWRLRDAYRLQIRAWNNYEVWAEETLTATLKMYQEENGQVVPEAEKAAWGIGQTEPGWLMGTAINGYTKSGYVRDWPDVGRMVSTNTFTSAAVLVYPLNFTTPGTYTVWLRGYAPNAAGDSVYVGFDGQWVGTLTGFVPQQWSWANINMQAGGQAVVVNVTRAGAHTLQLWPREDGLSLDRLLLTTNGTYVPIGNGPPESEIR